MYGVSQSNLNKAKLSNLYKIFCVKSHNPTECICLNFVNLHNLIKPKRVI